MRFTKLISLIGVMLLAITLNSPAQNNENLPGESIENYNNMFLTSTLGYANMIEQIDTVFKLMYSNKPDNLGRQHLQTEIVVSTWSGNYIRVVVVYKSYRFDDPPTFDRPFIISCIMKKSRFHSVDELPECPECKDCDYKEDYYPEFAKKFLSDGNKIKKKIKLPPIEEEKDIERD